MNKINEILDRVKGFIRDKKGSAEVIAFAILLIFIILAVAPKIQGIGNTISSGTDALNQNLEDQLGVGE